MQAFIKADFKIIAFQTKSCVVMETADSSECYSHCFYFPWKGEKEKVLKKSRSL